MPARAWMKSVQAWPATSSATISKSQPAFPPPEGTGQLFYDADNGSGAAVLFATLQAGTVLAATDCTVI
jgi:hypothetical protein